MLRLDLLHNIHQWQPVHALEIHCNGLLQAPLVLRIVTCLRRPLDCICCCIRCRSSSGGGLGRSSLLLLHAYPLGLLCCLALLLERQCCCCHRSGFQLPLRSRSSLALLLQRCRGRRRSLALLLQRCRGRRRSLALLLSTGQCSRARSRRAGRRMLRRAVSSPCAALLSSGLALGAYTRAPLLALALPLAVAGLHGQDAIRHRPESQRIRRSYRWSIRW